MKTKQLCYRIVIVSLLLIGIGVSAAAQRRGRDWEGYPNWGGGNGGITPGAPGGAG